jgi:hypothetical protein
MFVVVAVIALLVNVPDKTSLMTTTSEPAPVLVDVPASTLIEPNVRRMHEAYRTNARDERSPFLCKVAERSDFLPISGDSLAIAESAAAPADSHRNFGPPVALDRRESIIRQMFSSLLSAAISVSRHMIPFLTVLLRSDETASMAKSTA